MGYCRGIYAVASPPPYCRVIPIVFVFVRLALIDLERELAKGTRLHSITRHMMGLFQGRPGARAWRRHLSEHANRDGAGWAVVEDALLHVQTRIAA